MRTLFQKLMKNLKISFIEEESIIKYEEYYFNGIRIPKNIEFNVIWEQIVLKFYENSMILIY